MNIILLSGGSGKRLWPLSDDVNSKQFMRIFKEEDGTYSSMVQRVYGQIKRCDKDALVTVATAEAQVPLIREQIGDEVSVSIEPCRRDTFPAIALATAFLRDKKGLSRDDVVVVCPVDPYVEDTYFEALQELSCQAAKGEANLVLLGIEPTYPSAKYGYIIPRDKRELSLVDTFKEKPTEEVAAQYIERGALWNGGVFAFKLGYLMDKAHELLDFADYDDMFAKYETLPKISFDYAVVEKEEKIQVLRYEDEWKDLGTWNTLSEATNRENIGNVLVNDTNENVHVINELDIPIICTGLKDVVVVAGPNGILVADKHMSSYIKPMVEEVERRKQ